MFVCLFFNFRQHETFMINMLTTIPLLFIYLSVVYATAPIAQHQIFHAGPNSELVIKLRGYDADGDVLTATISPGDTNAGKLYQLSQVYSDYR